MSIYGDKDDLKVKISLSEGKLVVSLWDFVEQLLVDVPIDGEDEGDADEPESILNSKRSLITSLAYKALDDMVRNTRDFGANDWDGKCIGMLRTALLNSPDVPKVFQDACYYWLDRIAGAERDAKYKEQLADHWQYAYNALWRWVHDNFRYELRDKTLPNPGKSPEFPSKEWVKDDQVGAAMASTTRLPSTQDVMLFEIYPDWRLSPDEGKEKTEAELKRLLSEGWRVVMPVQRLGTECWLLLAKDGAAVQA